MDDKRPPLRVLFLECRAGKHAECPQRHSAVNNRDLKLPPTECSCACHQKKGE